MRALCGADRAPLTAAGARGLAQTRDLGLDLDDAVQMYDLRARLRCGHACARARTRSVVTDDLSEPSDKKPKAMPAGGGRACHSGGRGRTFALLLLDPLLHSLHAV
jgi:hypothetical protein